MSAPAIPSIGMPDLTNWLAGLSAGIPYVLAFLFITAISALLIAMWRGLGPFKKFMKRITVIAQNGNNLEIRLDKGRDFKKGQENMLEIQSDRTEIPGGLRGNVILYSPAPGKYEPAILELKKKEGEKDDPVVMLHAIHDDDAARLIFVVKEREIRQRFNLKSMLERWAGPIFFIVCAFLVALLLWQTWGQISGAVSSMADISSKQSATTAQLTQLLNRTYIPPMPGGG